MHIRDFGGLGSQVSWVYNWDSVHKDGIPRGLMHMPVLWRARLELTTNEYVNNSNSQDHTIATGSMKFFSFNEPNFFLNQACMSPQAAVDAYRK
ncbi:hypothetical protein QTJ16_006533 [Diplocarpon rosae]|uniref:Asl1-like glycosyl hydrolase catalytic domain-containing protein n=1 Tax=Diplocarpon rosae TaxID=946125 RepID=A0AAD9WCK5_9HELO|nr:hypothetical protein QTJ16_006533 [Diplocarpon rosae]